MSTSRSLLLPFLATLGLAGAAPATAALPLQAAEDVEVAEDVLSSYADPFCPPADVDPDGLDPADEPAEDPAPLPEDILDIDVADAPVDLDDTLDFCSDGDADAPAVSWAALQRDRKLDLGTLNLMTGGTVVREARLTKGTVPKALRPLRGKVLGRASRSAGAGFLELPVPLNAAGRKALVLAPKQLKLVVRTTLTLTSGERRARTQTIVLKRPR